LFSVIGAHLFHFQLRALYYTVMSNVEDDEEAQKLGVVGIAYLVGAGLNLDPQKLRKTAKLRNAIPIRLICSHLCYNDPLLVPIISLSMFLMGTHTRLRFRAHYGSHEEIQCQLRSFGIPISALPVSPRGEFNMENHQRYMAMQRAIEAEKSKRTGPLLPVAQNAKKKPEEKARSRQPIINDDVFVAAPQPNINEATEYGGGLMGFSNFDFLPSPSFANTWWGSVVGAPSLPSVVPTQRQLPVAPQSHITGPTSASRPPAKVWEPPAPARPYVIYDPLVNDVLLGRGKPTQDRPGNVRFRDMLDKNMDKYEQGEKGAKGIVSAYIIHIVKEEGGRFLKELEDGGWVEVDDATARAKVNHAFRARRGVFQANLKKEKITA
jgi:hypothetical protein